LPTLKSLKVFVGRGIANLPESLAVCDLVDRLTQPWHAFELRDRVAIALALALIQIHDSRLRGMVRDNRDTSRTSMTLRRNLEQGIVTAASIFAGASSGFNYARRREHHFPGEL
jgi:hypothetical protein